DAADDAAEEPGSAVADGFEPVHAAAGRVLAGRAADQLQPEPGIADFADESAERDERGFLSRQIADADGRNGAVDERQRHLGLFRRRYRARDTPYRMG